MSARHPFGWSYPPGCSGPPDEPEAPCECCGEAVDNCICPECPVCGAYGDKDCYSEPGFPRHNLTFSQDQLDGQKKLANAVERQREQEASLAKYWEEQQKLEEAEQL